MKGIFKIIVCFYLFLPEYSFSQDTIFTYDVVNQSLTYRPMPAYNINAVADSTNPSFGTYGVTSMPSIAPTNTYSGTQISLLQKASDYYSTFNFPFSAVTLIKYGFNITAAVIGRRTLLAFRFDVQSWTPPFPFRNLSDCNPYFDDGAIQYGSLKLTPVKYYYFSSPSVSRWASFSVIEVAEDIGTNSGYFGLAFDTTFHSNDSILLYNISYPKEGGAPMNYSTPVNGDTLCMKYGYVGYPNNNTFQVYNGGYGEYTSPFFDANFRIRGIRWSYQDNYKINRKGFYFLKYIVDSLATGINEINNKQTTISIYPNPFTSQTTITFSEVQKNSTIKIIDIIGKEIRTIIFKGKELIIEKGTMKEGVYLLQIIDEKKNILSRKIIIQ